MRKWILVLGIFSCSLLFLVSGSFLGYLASEQKARETPEEKPKRKPSENKDPIIGRITQTNIVSISKSRMPTPGAISQAQRYIQQLKS